MRVFIDTSALIKKYVIEKGSEEFNDFLENVSEIVVSPIYWIETNSALKRHLNDKSLTKQQVATVFGEIQKDLHYFHKIIWNEALEREAAKLIQKYNIRTLDSIQLASGHLSNADIFMTSDKKLYQTAKKELKSAQFI